MKIFEITQLAQEYARLSHQWCMLISFGWETDWQETINASPYLEGHIQILVDGTALMTFDTEEEMDHYYNLTVGDDGPTRLNPYQGPARVYALVISPEGELLNENT